MNSAVFHFLLGYEFPETMIIVQENPIVITSPKKAVILQQIDGLKIVIKNKDDSNLSSILDMLNAAAYAVIDKENTKGEFPERVFTRIKTQDATDTVLELLAVKEQSEIDYMFKSGVVANYLVQKGIELIRDNAFSKDALEARMDDRIRGVDNSLIELSFDPEMSSNHLRLGIRYRGYCTEIARRFLDDLTEEYAIQRYILGLVKAGVRTTVVTSQLMAFMADNDYQHDVNLYTIGLVDRELSFDKDIELADGMCFVLNIDGVFCNTFVIRDIPVFVTRKDTAEEYSATKMRFRNKSSDVQVVAKIKEHQKELLDTLIEEKTAFYKAHGKEKQPERAANIKEISVYQKDSAVPRSDKIHLDWDNFYILVPLLSYSVPFHISTVKNVSAVTQDEELRIRINFKDSKELREHGTEREWDTRIKFLTVKCADVEDLISQINEMRKEFNKPNISVPDQPVLKEKFRKYAITDVYMRTDNKGANKKILGNLELHDNGFKYNDVTILFSNIKNMFFQQGDMENKTILHFNLLKPVLHMKPTLNVQFFKKFTISYHDTSKRGGEEMELLREKEEEEELNRINAEFLAFVERIEQETSLKVQLPHRAFLGVHSREAVQFYLTNECIISIHELPFFILNFEGIEVVSFERVTFVTKTFDCIFVFHDKTRNPVTIGSIDTTRLGYLKEVFDSQNILFMENKVNINWANLIGTIMKDPLSFYENGAWSELLREAEDSESENSEEESSSAVSSDESDDDSEDETTTSYDESEEGRVVEEVEDDDEYNTDDDATVSSGSEGETISEDSGSESAEEISEEEKPKKRKTRK